MKRKPMSDAKLMLKVFQACIVMRVMPEVSSPCHKRLKSIIRKTK